MREILLVRPDLASYVENLIELLERMQQESHKPAGILAKSSFSELIPIIGSTSAGTARYWSEYPDALDGATAEQRVTSLFASSLAQPVRRRGELRGSSMTGVVALVQLNHPDDNGILEFLSAPRVKEVFPHSVAWRIDGESMLPRYRDGDLVVTALDQTAVDGEPAVVKQRDQIGVNCKVYREEELDVVLTPLNERMTAQRIPKAQIEWAYRVVCAVRLAGR